MQDAAAARGGEGERDAQQLLQDAGGAVQATGRCAGWAIADFRAGKGGPGAQEACEGARGLITGAGRVEDAVNCVKFSATGGQFHEHSHSNIKETNLSAQSEGMYGKK